jgi:hypothetical protein
MHENRMAEERGREETWKLVEVLAKRYQESTSSGRIPNDDSLTALAALIAALSGSHLTIDD